MERKACKFVKLKYNSYTEPRYVFLIHMPNVNVVSQLVVNVVIPIVEILYAYIYTFFRPNIDNRHAFQQ